MPNWDAVRSTLRATALLRIPEEPFEPGHSVFLAEPFALYVHSHRVHVAAAMSFPGSTTSTFDRTTIVFHKTIESSAVIRST